MATPQLSFEFFPPRTEAQTRRFWRTVGCLETIQADWFSMTYGALGSASQASLDTVEQLTKDSKTPIAAHLTCAGQTQSQLLEVLDTLKAMGVEHIVALRGDNVSESKAEKYYRFRYATELVELIAQTGHFDISVAAYPEVHPEATSAQSDMDVLKRKFELGASRALTQFFFDPDVFLRWRDSALKAGVDKPLIPGILPIHNIEKVIDFSRRCGASVPSELVSRFQSVSSAEDSQSLAIEHCVALCKTLQKEGVDAFHLYTLNQSELAFEVSKELVGASSKGVAAA